MSTMRLTIGLCLLLLLIGSERGNAQIESRKQTDADAVKKQVIGVWQSFEEEEGIQLRTTIDFRKDGTFSTKLVVNAFGASADLKFEGAWKCDGNHVEIKVVKGETDTLKGKVLRFKFVVVEKELPLLYPTDEKGKPGSVYRRLEKK